MKVYISADIEGNAFTTVWDETRIDHPEYAAARQQMTAEVKAACEGAIAAGADYILVNDAHDYAVNLDVNELPECVEVIRGWSGSPMGMVDGVDDSFDAAMFIGYHSAAGRCGNPLSHTFTTKTTCVKLNDMVCSEFLLYSWACARKGVPTVLLAGDKIGPAKLQKATKLGIKIISEDDFMAMIADAEPIDSNTDETESREPAAESLAGSEAKSETTPQAPIQGTLF